MHTSGFSHGHVPRSRYASALALEVATTSTSKQKRVPPRVGKENGAKSLAGSERLGHGLFVLDQNGVARAREEFLLVSARVAFAPVDLVVELIAIILRLQLRRVVNVDLDGWAWVQRLVVGVVELGDVAARAAAGMRRCVARR